MRDLGGEPVDCQPIEDVQEKKTFTKREQGENVWPPNMRRAIDRMVNLALKEEFTDIERYERIYNKFVKE